MRKQIPEERQFAYYGGIVIAGVGMLLFLSFFVTGLMALSDHSRMTDSSGPNAAIRAFIGFILVAVGSTISNVAAKGLAGSGVILDPEKAREDLEPYSRMAGGMVKDALDEADIHLNAAPKETIKVRCRSCGKLNEETAKFCNDCGKPI